VDGLFSVLVTLGVVPIIRCPKGGAAEAVAAALEQRLRDALKGRANLFSEGAGGGPAALAATLSRPLLVLFDRNMDLGALLQHNWSYKPLVQVGEVWVGGWVWGGGRRSVPWTTVFCQCCVCVWGGGGGGEGALLPSGKSFGGQWGWVRD
jgi:hypothetical protein